MQERILKFISALRAAGVRISLAESADAFQAIQALGIQDRETFRLTLRATLVKEQSHFDQFNELFPLFFSTGTAPMLSATDDLTAEEANMIAAALDKLAQDLQDMLERLMEGEPLTQEEMDQLSEKMRMQNADDLRYQQWLAHRMEQAMQFGQVRAAMQALMDMLQQLGMQSQRQNQLESIMQQNMQSWQDQLHKHAGQQIAENLSQMPRDEGVDHLMNRPFNSLGEKDMGLLRNEVRRLAATLRSRVSLRQKRAKSGTLDPKATIRANLKHNGVPFQIKYRNKQVKPKLVVLCDISTSMRYCSELMLSMIFTLQDLVSKTHAFAFIDHLEYISPDFIGRQADEAINEVLVRMPPGYYSTDMGYALTNLENAYLGTIDSRTSLIVVGDGRNNYNNPQIEIFKQLVRRAHRTVWINPEPQIQWGTGDSDMQKYAPYCDDILRAGTLRQLTNAIDTLLN